LFGDGSLEKEGGGGCVEVKGGDDEATNSMRFQFLSISFSLFLFLLFSFRRLAIP